MVKREDIIRMAREAGIITNSPYLMPHDHVLHGIERFAALVAAAEREACRQIALRKMRLLKDTERAHYTLTSSVFIPSRFGFDIAAVNEGVLIADAIAARSQQ